MNYVLKLTLHVNIMNVVISWSDSIQSFLEAEQLSVFLRIHRGTMILIGCYAIKFLIFLFLILLLKINIDFHF
jgi:hypothetical protein